MRTTNTTLVLGAGSSIAMGYPTGAQLREKIIQLTNPELEQFSIEAGLRALTPSLFDFVEAFRMSQMYSIDAFLARRPEFTLIGKQAIAAVLLACEQKSRLDSCTHNDAWYQYLWNRFGDMSWEELDFSRLRIVTFNYDRSLEHYLVQAIQYSHGKDLSRAVEKLKTLQIVHVYGSLSATLPGDAEYLRYGYGIERGAAAIAAKSLQVIPEGRNDNAVLQLAREHLLWADRIGFLGFGFDRLNMERLDTVNSCKRRIAGSDRMRSRQIFATSLGMTESEVSAASQRIWPEGESNAKPRFYASACLDMLRESALLQ